MFDLVVENGLVTGCGGSFPGTIAIKNGKVAGVFYGKPGLASRERIDASERVVFPGAIDCHVHFGEPGFEWREDFWHGTRSAAAGGVSTVLDMPMQNNPSTTTGTAFDAKVEIAKSGAVVDFALWGGLVDSNMTEMKNLYARGAVGLKAFLSPTTADYSRLDTGLLRDALKHAADLGVIVGLHCEDASIVAYEEQKARLEKRKGPGDYLLGRPLVAELLAVETVLELAAETGAKVHVCHVSHPRVAEAIKQGQRSGLRVTAETCPHYLVFSEDDMFKKNGTLFKCAPPLRSRQDSGKLWDYLFDGTIGCVASDHSPGAPEEKQAGAGDVWKAWGGISGVQTTFQVMFSEIVHERGLKPEILARVCSYQPARVFGLYPRKGVLMPGSDADIIIVNPDEPWEIGPDELFYKNKLSAFVGVRGRGAIEQTIVRGRVVFKKGRITANPGYGCFVSPGVDPGSGD